MNNTPLRIFIGGDPRQKVSYNVLQYSIVSRSSAPIQICPLIIDQLPIKRQGLTPFTYSRYLVPWLCNYEGYGLFMDADMIVLDDIAKLFACADGRSAVQVVKSAYRFEWASVMLFNCEKCAPLTPELIETADNNMLFGFGWTDEEFVGALPSHWNHLVGYDAPQPNQSLIHYTQGVPGFPEIGDCEYAREWHEEHQTINYIESWSDIMGPSVHATKINNQLLPKLRIQEYKTRYQHSVQNEFEKTQMTPPTITSRDTPSLRYWQQILYFLELHHDGDPKQSQVGEQVYPGGEMLTYLDPLKAFITETASKSLLDYGSGKGLQYCPLDIKTPDGKQYNGLQSLFSLTSISCYDAAYAPLAELPAAKSDIVLAIHLLESIPEDDIDWVLDEIFGLANKAVFLAIRNGGLGADLVHAPHECITNQSNDWWKDRVMTVQKRHPGVNFMCLIASEPKTQVQVFKN